MDKDRWSAINRIFHAALEIEQGQRCAFVLSESGDDTELKAEIDLLLQADANAGSYLESPLIAAGSLLSSRSPLVPGDLLCDRFRILREIAEGGMGHVFDAFDEELAVHVALKVIRPEIASTPEAIARFRQEVRLARSITHPNICRTFDIEREVRELPGPKGTAPRRVELIFLTMEFLSGETLAQRIQRAGPIPIGGALAFARQIATALHAAHSLGVVHRDMKPANIMLVKPESPSQYGPRVVVTDFGLARLDPLLLSEGVSSFTNTGHPIGTLAYMAPEQLEGAAVSPATDIYAFGLILFEMLTGERVFPSNNLLSGIAQRLHGTLLLDQRLSRETPVNWRHALNACLAVNPSDRPRDATHVLAMLEEDPRKLLPRLRHSVTFSKSRSFRLSLGIAILIVVVALFMSGLRLYISKASSQVTPGALIYLTPVKNQTGERPFDSLTELIQAGLSQSIQINLLDQGRVGDILQQMTLSPEKVVDFNTAREIAMRAGAVRVIFVTVTGSQGDYMLNVDIQKPDNTPTTYRDHWAKSFAWRSTTTSTGSTAIPAELLTQVRSACDWIRHQAGESANDIARLDSPPEDVTTNSWDALSEYQHGLQLNHDRRPAEAVLSLQKAIQIDPKFALAYGRLADIRLTLHQEDEGFAAYKKALDPSLERRLSRRERDRIQGMYAIDSWDYPAAVDAFRDYQSFYPNDIVGWEYPTLPLTLLGRDDEAIANLERALALDGNDTFALHALTAEYIGKGDLGAASAALGRIKQPSHSASTTILLGSIAFLEGHYDQAQTLIASLKSSPQLRERSRSYEMLADLSAERGDFANAIRVLDEGVQEDAAQGNPAAQSTKLTGRAWMKAKLGDFAGCSADLRAALAADSSPQLILTVETILGQSIQIAPAGASRGLRRQMMDLARNLPPDDFGVITNILHMRSRAESTLAAGAPVAALQQFRDLAAIDAPAAPREYLGRALLAAAHQQDTAQATVLRREAMQAYAVVALRPGLIWQSPVVYPPGFLADESQSYLQLAQQFDDAGVNTDLVRAKLTSLRADHPISNPTRALNEDQH